MANPHLVVAGSALLCLRSHTLTPSQAGERSEFYYRPGAPESFATLFQFMSNRWQWQRHQQHERGPIKKHTVFAVDAKADSLETTFAGCGQSTQFRLPREPVRQANCKELSVGSTKVKTQRSEPSRLGQADACSLTWAIGVPADRSTSSPVREDDQGNSSKSNGGTATDSGGVSRPGFAGCAQVDSRTSTQADPGALSRLQ